MNKAELVDELTGRLGDKKTATAALDAVLDEIQRSVSKGDKVSIAGFGVFERRVRGARTARNPRTGEAVKVKKTSVPAFRAGQAFKDVVAGKKKVAAAKKTAAKSTAKKTTAKAPAKKTTTRAAAAKKTATAAKKTTAAKKATTAKKTAAKKTAAKKTAAKKTTARKTTARKR